jgi:hypothetical protein
LSATDDHGDRPLPLEVAVVWLLFLVAAAAMLVTYARIAPEHLYNVSHSGLAGGAGRVLVFSNFSTALAAIAVLLVLLDRLSGPAGKAAAVAGILLCAPVFSPGVVDEADLDAKPVNGLAGLGVLVALGLTGALARHGRCWTRRAPGDPARLVVAVAATFVSLPWVAAELGFFLDGVPLLGSVFQTGSWHPKGLTITLPAVHHGHHHGMDGLLLLLTALLLSRIVVTVRSRGLRVLLAAYLALMAAYAVGNMANDFWIEQVWKRGWTTWEIPNVLRPTVSVAWGLIVLGAAALFAVGTWWGRRAAQRPAV